MTKQEMQFKFLDELRETGVTNMLGAGIYLQESFNLSKYEAKAVLLEWIKTFNERNPISPPASSASIS